MLTLEHTTSERTSAAIYSSTDPTAVPPEWSITTGPRTDPGDWHQGQRRGTWDTRNGRVEVESALLGAGEVLQLTQGVTHDLWVRFWVPGDTNPTVLLVAQIQAR